MTLGCRQARQGPYSPLEARLPSPALRGPLPRSVSFWVLCLGPDWGPLNISWAARLGERGERGSSSGNHERSHNVAAAGAFPVISQGAPTGWRQPATSFKTHWIERTGEHMVRKQLRRVEASLLAGSVRHDGFLTGCTFREPPDPLDAGRGSQQ